tara:strand:- start:1028 stop:1498 length:471 start_codon:yes stop_codon:yes gene_type:complete
MKKYFILAAFLISHFSFSQSQVLNGVSLNGPNGFVKSGDLMWTKGNDVISVGNVGTERVSSDSFKLQCEKGSRATEYLHFETIEMNGKESPICIQMGDNEMLIGQTLVYRDGYNYIVTAGSYPGDYDSDSYQEKLLEAMEQVGYMLGYMITRITKF